MPKYRLRIFLILMALFAIIIGGCQQVGDAPPEKPMAAKVIDLPGDDGTGTIVQWRHYNASSAVKYKILRGESKNDIETQIGEISAQLTLPSLDTSSVNDFSDDNYYLIIDDDKQPPLVEVVKANPENEDSIKAIGQKLQKVELTIVPENVDDRELVLASGNYYRVNPPQSILNESQYATLNNKKIDVDNTFLEEGDKNISVEHGFSEYEKEFIKEGARLMPPAGPDAELIKKYGLSVASFVTEDKRYCVSYNPMKSFDNDTSEALEPGKEYYYKVIAYNKDDVATESEVLTGTPIDNEPNPLQITSILADKNKKSVVLNWAPSRDSDLNNIEIYLTDIEDTLQEEGELLKTVDASWTKAKIEDIDIDSTHAFYLKAYDDKYSSVSNIGTVDFIDFAEVNLPPNLRVEDHPNDDAMALDLMWEPPSIRLSYWVIDQDLKKEVVKPKENVYLFNGEIVQFDPDSTIPEKAEPVKGYIKEIPSDDMTLTVSYDIFANIRAKAAFAEVKLEGMGRSEDFFDKEEIGQAIFKNIEPGKYKISAQLKNKNGFDFENEEAFAEMEIEIKGQEKYTPPPPDKHYIIYRATIKDGETPEKEQFEEYEMIPSHKREFVDRWSKDEEDLYRILTSYDYAYFMRAVSAKGNIKDSEILGPITPKSNAFHSQKLIILVFLLLFIGISGFYLLQGRRGKKYYIRPIAGISHIDEALGRATEMGKPILYIMGLGAISMLSTLASMTILGRVAKKAAEYQNRLLVPAADPIVMLVAQETVRSAYLDAGRPDAYSEDDIYFVTRSQFSYAAAVSGIMMRENTATHFFMGWFAAESLILSEAGARAGAIQIAGTDAPAQLPFFITSCDYTLMGEELYAASAYMSKDPMQISSLKIQDTLKAIYIVIMILGTAAISLNIMWFVNFFKLTIDK
ncbi:MAG: DUF6754 domain-containing protein [Candidatus Zixiibacteriota bacterium]